MSKVDDARTAVGEIDGEISSLQRFIKAYAKIVDAGKTVKEAERLQLQNIVVELISKMRVGSSFTKLIESARAFVDDLTAAIIGTGIKNINDRNNELSALIEQFSVQIAGADADAVRLTKITSEIKKATDVVNTIKTLASQLSSLNSTRTEKLEAILTALEELSATFPTA